MPEITLQRWRLEHRLQNLRPASEIQAKWCTSNLDNKNIHPPWCNNMIVSKTNHLHRRISLDGQLSWIRVAWSFFDLIHYWELIIPNVHLHKDYFWHILQASSLSGWVFCCQKNPLRGFGLEGSTETKKFRIQSVDLSEGGPYRFCSIVCLAAFAEKIRRELSD